ARAQLARAYQLHLGLRLTEATEACKTSLSLYERIDDDAGISQACYWLAALVGWQGDAQASGRYARESVRRARLTDDPGLTGKALVRTVRDLPAAELHVVLGEATELLNRTGDYRQLQTAYINVGHRASREGRYTEALAFLDDAHRFAQK